ncbi:MAG TPA: nuclear transport factor 2 family protein [Tissierellia bacterium]|nr:nuclear transport factor 2 family protein [Tissierellia bacterium]
MTLLQPLLDQYRQLVLAKDIEGFLALYDRDVKVFDAFDAWRYDGNHQWRVVPTDWFTDLKEHVVDVTFRDVTVIGRYHLFVVYGLIEYHHGADPNKHLTNRFSWIVKRDGNDFRIVHEHTSLPIDRLTNYFIRE